jgi:hypothetical protein
MNTIELGLTGNDPDLSIKIDGEDVFSMEEFKGDFIPADVRSFLFNEYMYAQEEKDDVFNGTMLVGTCGCDCHGCDDIIVKISTNSKTTKWIIMQDRNRKKKRLFSFNAKEYAKQISNLKDAYYSYSWESNEDNIRRKCTEFIRTYKSKDGFLIDGVKIAAIWDRACEKIINPLNNIMEIYYYSDWEPSGEGIGTPYHNWKVKFDGKTLESAMKALKRFATKNLIKNNDEVSLRPKPFRLLYTKDKEKMNELLKNKSMEIT